MSKLHVAYKDGRTETFYALADVEPNPASPPPNPYPEVVWASGTGISGVQAPFHAHLFTNELAGIWTTED